MKIDWTPELIAEWLNKLPFVRWDRFAETPIGEHFFTVVYGWIDRDDGHADYVQLEFVSWHDKPGSCTSSAKYSPEITRIFLGEDAEHIECQRVEDRFGDLVPSAIHLRVAA